MSLKDLDDKAEGQLASLDQRFIVAAAPRVARAVDDTVDAARRTRRMVRERDLGDLNSLDAKWATKGPLALFREIPQLLAIVVGIVFVIGTIAAAHDLKNRRQADGSQSTSTDDGTVDTVNAPGGVALGPTIGKPANDYLALAARSLDDAASKTPDEQRLALVTLKTYYRPELASGIVSGLTVKRAWVLDSTGGKLAGPLTIEVTGDTKASLTGFYSRKAKSEQTDAGKWQELADTTTNDPTYQAFYSQYASLSRHQSRQFSQDCACVYTFAVLATPTQLQQLRSRPGVRGIEVAGRGATLASTDITTLLPTISGVVPTPVIAPEPPS